jgi:type IV pilus modification protein PilV
MNNCQAKSRIGEMKSKQRQCEDGFTLIEILIALSIFAVGILAVASMQVMAIKTNHKASNVTETVTWAQDTMEELISLPWSDARLADGTRTETAPDGSTVTITVQDDMVGAATVNIKRIRVQTSYLEGGVNKTVTMNGSLSLIAAQ